MDNNEPKVARKITIAIASYNQARMIGETIESSLAQTYKNKDIIVLDDCSSDNSVEVISKYKVKVYKNDFNLGFAYTFNKLIELSSGEYIIFMCSDDFFTDKEVVSDVVKQFDYNNNIGVVGRHYYQYFDGDKTNPVMTIRRDIYRSSCQPSGMSFRKKALVGKKIKNKIFAEIPLLVKDVISDGWGYAILPYDTIAARLHPGPKGNAATNPVYYNVTPRQSIIANWSEVMGFSYIDFYNFIQVKNRFPENLLMEIGTAIKLKPAILFNPIFYVFALLSIIIPSKLLSILSKEYRRLIVSKTCKIIKREHIKWLN